MATILQQIYTTLGCTSLQRSSLPTILFHLSKDLKNHQFILDEPGWTQLQHDWVTKVDRKGNGSLVDLILPPEVHLSFYTIHF